LYIGYRVSRIVYVSRVWEYYVLEWENMKGIIFRETCLGVRFSREQQSKEMFNDS